MNALPTALDFPAHLGLEVCMVIQIIHVESYRHMSYTVCAACKGRIQIASFLTDTEMEKVTMIIPFL